MAVNKARRRSRRLAAVVLCLIGVPTALVLAKPRWAVSFATQYVEQRRSESRPLVLVLVRVGSWRELEPGFEARDVAGATQGQIGFRVSTWRALRVDPRRLRLRVLEVSGETTPMIDMVSLAERTGALALMNTSYFEPDLKPMGAGDPGRQTAFAVAQGRQHAPRRIFVARVARRCCCTARTWDWVAWIRLFRPGRGWSPTGAAHHKFRNAGMVTRRSALGVDKKGRVLLATTDVWLGGLSLPELAELLAAAEPEGLGAWRAINCDGGTSTQMMLRHRRQQFTIRTSVHVPVYLGVFAAEKP